MAAVIDFPPPPIQYDRRAVHRIISDPSALDRINDTDALAQEGIALAHNALATTDVATKDRLIRSMGGKFIYIRRIAQEGAALLSESQIVDPYSLSGPDAA